MTTGSSVHRRGVQACLLLGLVTLAACESQRDLGRSDCLPLRVPAQLVLAREAGLYTVRDDPTPFLMDLPRQTANDDFQRVRLQRTVPAGTRLEVDKLQQHHGFDSGKGRISAFGTLADGQRFEYAWGAGTTIGRAPWESAAVPRLRTVSCGD